MKTETSKLFFERPILNSPYQGPSRHWELDASGQPTHKIIEKRRDVTFLTPTFGGWPHRCQSHQSLGRRSDESVSSLKLATRHGPMLHG